MFDWLKPFLCAAFLLGFTASGPQAATWQEHKFAGFGAFDEQDYSGAVERFQTSLVIAYEQQAAPDDLGAILENLATAYLAAGQPRNALAAMARWDKLLVQWANNSWAAEQAVIRDELTRLIVEVMASDAEQGAPEADSAPAAVAAGTRAESGAYAIHLESAKAERNVEPSWAALKASYPTQLAGKTLLVKEVDLGDKGTFFRMLVKSFADSSDAESVCEELKGLGQYCAVLPLE